MSRKTQESAHNALEDPLSGSTRSTKRLLFVFSSICLLIVLTGVSPNAVSVFGLQFPGLTLSILNVGLLILLSLTLVTFVVYGVSDYFRFRHRLDVYNLSRAGDIDSAIHANPNDYDEMTRDHYEEEFRQMTGYRPFEIPHRPTKTLVLFRFILDMLLPLLFGLASLILFLVCHVKSS